MNLIYRVVWNASQGTWHVVSEFGKSRGKTKVSRAARRRNLAMAAVSLTLAGPAAWAAGILPAGGAVVAGSGSISQNGSAMIINQSTGKMAIDWQSFSIGQGNSVNFVQPSASAVALNRVLGSDVSVIQGALTANGQVFLVNPNGVLFSPTAQVNVGGLVASTLNISPADFMAGNYTFSGGSSNAIVNQGNITAANGGTIALIAAKISNTGSLTANSGNVLLGAGSKVTLDLGGPVKLQVDQPAIDALIENGGAIKADGGLIYLTAKAAGDLVSTVINNTGVIEAQTLGTGEKGQIYLLGDMARNRITVGGTLDASAPHGGDGGFIETSAATVNIDPAVKVSTLAPAGTTGQWLIDPYDVQIAASGGNLTGATVAAALNSTNVTIDTTNSSYGTGASASGTGYASAVSGGNGDITVNDAITKTGGGATTLTLKAHNDININQAITSTSGRLNVVLTADQDNNGSGNVNFGSAGKVITKDGNFYVGSVSGSYDTVTAAGQNFTMASGSYIDAGLGNLDISVKGNIQLPDNSGQSVKYALTSAYNDGSSNYYRYFNSGVSVPIYSSPTQYLRVSTTGGSITSANTDAAVADIVTSVDTTLAGNNIGSAGNPIKVSGPADPYGLLANPTYSNKTFASVSKTLSVNNFAGDSYVNEIGVQIFKTVSVNIGNQASKTQNIQLMGDPGGDGTNGTGHVILNTDANGVLNLATGDINTSGVAGVSGSYTSTPQGTDPSVFPTSVSITAPNITFADDSVNTGGYVPYYYQGTGTYYRQNWGMSSYGASFSAYASNSMTSSQVNGAADIRSTQVTLSGPTIGTAIAPVELGSGSSLTLDNTGGSIFAKVVDDSFGTVTLNNRKTAGEFHLLWSGGDHIDYSSDGNGSTIATISGGASNGSDFTATHGIDTSRSGRSVSLNAVSGYLALDTNSVNLNGGTFTATIANSNTDRNAGKAIFATNAKDGLAEITAGDVIFNIYSSAAGSINDIEIAKGGIRTNNSLAINAYQGDVDIRELTDSHFKSVNVTLNGANTAQNIAIDLAGADDINFSDSGSAVVLDANKVNLSANNRSWNLQAPNRAIQVDGNSLSTGNYTLYGSVLKLNGDILTDGGYIELTGSAGGIALMKSVRIDSNADDLANSASTGTAGAIRLSGNLSATAPGYALTVDSSSTTTSGGDINLYGSANNSAGSYLSGLAVTSKGSANNNDGAIYLYGNYYLNGNFSSTGNTLLYNSGMTIDTEQGNTADGGNIAFAGYNLSTVYGNGTYTFNTATTAAGKNGGNVDLYGTYAHGTLNNGSFNVTTTGGTGGSAGGINLPAISATTNGANNAQSFNGGVITLHGDINTERGNVSLNGDVRLANNVTIDTWQTASSNVTQSGTAGSVTIGGIGVSAISAGQALTINTSTDTGSGYYNPPTNTTGWTHNGGAVSITAGNAGGAYLGTLTVNTSKNGTYNSGVDGSITLNNVTTSGNQTYTGGALTFAGAISGDTITVNTRSSGASVGGSGLITANALLLNGANTAYSLASGSGHKVGTLAATGATNLAFLNNDVDLTIGSVSGVNGISASGTIDIATNNGNITIAKDVATTSTANNAVVVNAGKSAAAGAATGGDILVSGTPAISTGAGGRATLYTGSLSGSTGLAGRIGSGSGMFRYNSDETATNYTTALGSGMYAIYRERPTVTVSAGGDTKTYDGRAYSGGAGVTASGFVNGDTSGILMGSLSYGGTAQGAVNAGNYTITPSGYANGLGYAIAYDNGTLTINPRTVTVTADAKGKTQGEADPLFTWNVTGGNLVNGDSLTGVLSRTAGDNPGNYQIQQGTLDDMRNPNYQINFVGADLTIKAAALKGPAGDAVSTVQTAASPQSSIVTAVAPAVAPMSNSGNAPASGDSAPTISGGLALLPLDGEHAQASTGKGSTAGSEGTNLPAVMQSNTTPAGFLKVFVVEGGIHMPAAKEERQ